jgi:hypothetical protein
VVGVSNIVTGRADPVVVWSDLIAMAVESCPGLDLAGYELGEDLKIAVAVGFVESGPPLRVWMR